MEIDVEKELERFEKFALSERLSIAKETFNDHTFFSETETRDVWSGWLAAKKQAMEEMEPALQKFRAASMATHPLAIPTLIGEGIAIVNDLYAKKGE